MSVELILVLNVGPLDWGLGYQNRYEDIKIYYMEIEKQIKLKIKITYVSSTSINTPCTL